MPGISRSAASSSVGEIVGMVRDDVGAVAVRANLERVLVLDFEEVGNLPEDARDRGVIQAAGLRLDAEVEHPRAARRQRRGDRRARVGRAVAEQAAAAAGAAHLGGRRAGRRARARSGHRWSAS